LKQGEEKTRIKARIKDKGERIKKFKQDSRTCPPTGGFQNLSACWRISELVRCFKPRRGGIILK